MKPFRRPRLLTFGFALLATAIAALLTLVTPLKTGGYFILFGVAVLLSARYGGLGAGLFSILVGSLAQLYFFLPPIDGLGLVAQDDFARLGLFILIGFVIAWLTAERETAKEVARRRALQHLAVAELGQRALAGLDLPALFEETTHRIAKTLNVEYSHMLELLPGRNELVQRAGHGWGDRLAGDASISVGGESQAGLTLASKEPVIVEDLRKDKRFSGASILLDQGIVSGASVIIQGDGHPFGVLGAYSTRRRRFTQDDVNFLQSISNVLAEAISRQAREKQIRDQREWLSITLSSIGDGVIAIDKQGAVTFINSVAEELTGWTAQASIGKPIDQVFCLVDENTGESVATPVARMIQDGTRVELGDDVALIAKDGHHIAINDSAAPIRDGKGDLAGLVLIFRDVTERRRIEQELKESEERYRTFAEAASDAILNIDEGDAIQWVNRAAEDIFGYAAGEINGQPVTLLMPGYQRQAIQDDLATHEDHLARRALEIPGVRKDGKPIALEISFGDFIRNGKPQLTAIVRDISERKKAQEQLLFQATILQNVQDSVIVTDLQGQVIYWNEGSTTVYGYTQEEMLGASLALLYPDQSVQSLMRDLATLRQGKDFNGEWQGRHKDGSLHWVTLKTTMLRDPAGEPFGYLSVSTDITQRKQAERRLEAQYAVTRILSGSESLAGAAPQILEEICQTAGWQVGVIWCLDNAADVLRCVGLWRVPGLDIREFERLTREILFPVGVGLPGRVWESRTPQWIKDVASDVNFPRAKVAAKNNLHSAMGFPIVTGEQFTGVIEFLSPQTRPPDSALTEMFHSLASQIGQFIQRKQTEDALRLSEEQHSIILQGVADGITAQDAEGRLIYANIAAARLIGYPSPEELLNAPIAQVVEKFKIMDAEGNPMPPERLPGRVAMLTKAPANDQLHFSVVESGEESWSQVNAAPILDEQGNVQFVINIFHDVTEQRRAEAAVREQRELLQVTLASIGDAVISTDAYGNVRFMNPVAEALTGWKMEEAAGKPLEKVFELISEETGEPVPSPFGRVMHDRAVIGLTNHTMLITRSGARVPIDDSGAPIRDASGDIIGVVLVFRDITERRKAEREVSRLATIVKASEDAIISQRLDGTVLTWNPGAERLYGYAAEEIIGRPITITYPPERLYEYEDIIARLIRGETLDHFDTVRLTKDGRRLHVSLSVALLRDAEGQITGVSKIARNITDQKRAERVTRFLAEASDVLVSSLDYETTLASVARLIVPEIADWCAVSILDKDGALKRLALAHVDPAKLELANELLRRYPGDPNANQGVHNVIRTGKPEIYPVIDDEMISRSARDADHLRLLMEIGFSSSMVVPLNARNRTLGAITFVSSESHRHFDAADLALAQELARRVALAVENARLYQQAQELNEELEHRVVSRTIELQNTNAKLQSEISERQRANDQLRLLSGHLEKAREEERIRIAREIHDEIGQVLTAIKMDLSMLGHEMVEGNLGDDPQAEIDSTTRLVDEAIQTMHHIVRELRPEVLDHLDLRSALEWQVQEFQSRTRIESRFESELDELDLDSERSTALFRILQETLTNVARHAQANRVEATLKKVDGQLVMQVQDDGKGIPDDRVTNSETFGILGMRERARALGGDVDIQSVPDHGTMVTVRIPV